MSDEVILELQASLQKFIDHVDSMQREEDEAGNGLEKQFRELRDLTMKQRDDNTIPATEGRKPHNMKKNRYKDILPFDSTRVTLKEIPDEPGSDYINANFIEGLDFAYHYYIASQGPLPNTVDDFWRMLWENDIIVIFMACKLVELGKKKCEQYWPDDVGSKKQFGEIEVTLLNAENRSEHYTIRHFEASYNGETRTLIQLHYTGWPDHDIPEDIDVILEMIAEMRRIRKDHHPVASKRPPAVIHCSAGCGRTGTICAIDYAWDILQTGKLTLNFDLFEIIKHMREQRQSMIQTPDQYEMVYKATQQLFKEHLDMTQDHEYGNLQFGQNESEDEGDDETELQTTSGEKHRKDSIVPEIKEALHNYGIDTEDSVPAEDISQSSLKTTLFEHPQAPVLTTETSYEPIKVNENHQRNAADLSTHTNLTVKKFEMMQNNISVTTPMQTNAKTQHPLQTTAGQLVHEPGSNFADNWKHGNMQPQPILLQQTVSNSNVNKQNLSSTSNGNKKGNYITKINVGGAKSVPTPSDAAVKSPSRLNSQDFYSEIKPIPSDAAVTSHGRLNSQDSYSEIKPIPSDAADKSHGRLDSQASYSYAYNLKPLDTKGSGAYAYASVGVDGSQESDRSAGNNIYSLVKKTQNDALPADFYTPVRKASQSKKPATRQSKDENLYETVKVGSEEESKDNEAPSIPHRGYIDEPPKQISSTSPTDKDKSKGMSKIGGSSYEFGKRIEKKFKGPRPPPAEWTKGKH
ncbi:hypothetical protein ACJMK2_016602 [Sinanodonta woodiana]|uniref:protein-tyrosine-phosphatase n=1 Tax=Sinanodonta woodiana TaxID=1069815 RepID=A0ABD3UVH3_SINWO